MASCALRRRWAGLASLAAAALFTLGFAIGHIVCAKSALPVDVERKMLAGQIGLDVHELELDRERLRWPADLLRTWRHPGAVIFTSNSRLTGFVHNGTLPQVACEGEYVSPVGLREATSCAVGSMYALPQASQLDSPPAQVRDLAVMAAGAVLGLSVTDVKGQEADVRLVWEGVAEGYPTGEQPVDVELRLEAGSSRVPRRVRVQVIPRTQQLSFLVVDEW